MFDDFREWLSDNLRYIGLGLAVIVLALLIGLIVKLVRGSGSDKPKKNNSQTEELAETGDIVETPAETEAADSGDNALEQNAFDDVNAFISEYYQALENVNEETLNRIVENFTEEDLQAANLQKEYTESYQNISCYTKKGLDDDSYVVYVVYDVKIINIETLCPSLSQNYIAKNDQGEFYLVNFEANEEVRNHMSETSLDEDAQNLIASVQQRYSEALESDTTLAEFIQSLDGSNSQVAGGEGSGTSDGDSEINKVVTVTETVNIRADSTTDAEILDILEAGGQITRVRVLDNGWSEVKLKWGGTGYILSEYIQE